MGLAEEKWGPYVRIVSESIFVRMMAERAASRQWRALDCIQACVKANRGLGKYIPVRFTADMLIEKDEDGNPVKKPSPKSRNLPSD